MAYPILNSTPQVNAHPQLHNQWVDVQGHFSATGDGTTDDTAAIQAAIDFFDTTSDTGIGGGTLFFPEGSYRITSTINFFRKGLRIKGVGSLGNTTNFGSFPGHGTTLRWDGSAGVDMINVQDCKGLHFEDIFFQGNITNVPSELIFYESAGGSIGTNSELTLKRCAFGFGSWTVPSTTPGDTATYAVRFGGFNANNDQFRFEDCLFEHVGTGIQIDQTQSIWGLIENCLFDVCTVAGIETSASTQVINGTFNDNAIDIKVNSTAGVNVFGYWSENADLMAKLTGSGGKLKIWGGLIRVASGYAGTNLVEHDACGGGGGILLDGIFFDDAGNSGVMPKIKADGNTSSAAGFVTIRHCPQVLIGDLDITAGASGAGVICDLQLDNLTVNKLLTASASLSTTIADYEFSGNTIMARAALSTSATDGFLYIPTCAGAPSGTPTTKTGTAPIVYDTTNNRLYVYDGGWVDVGPGIGWTSFSPTLGGSGWAIGNGTIAAAYRQMGKHVTFRVQVTFGSTSTFGAAASPTITLPVTAAGAFAGDLIGHATDEGTADYALGTTRTTTVATWFTQGTTDVYGFVTSTAPFTWVSTDKLYMSGTYEAA